MTTRGSPDALPTQAPPKEPRPNQPSLPPRESGVPSGKRPTFVSQPTPAPKYKDVVSRFLEHIGQISRMSAQAVRAMFRRPFEIDSTLYQLEALGVKSLSITVITAVFTG